MDLRSSVNKLFQWDSYGMFLIQFHFFSQVNFKTLKVKIFTA